MNNLKKLRIKEKLTIRELAEITNFNYAQLSMIENNKACFTQKQILVFTKFFKVSADYLLGIDEKQDYKKIPKIIYEDDEGKIISIDYDIFIPKQVLLNNENNTLLFVDVANPNKRRVFKLKKIEK